MDNLSNDAENKALDHLTGRSTFTITGPLKLALLTSEPDDDAPGAELDGGSYARQTINFNAAEDGTTANSGEIVFSNLPEGTVAGFAIFDSSGTPQRLFHGPTSRVLELATGDTVSVEPGSLTLSLG